MIAKAPWNLKEVLFIHLFRLIAGLVIVGYIYPALFPVTSFAVEVTDRMVVLVLVIWAIHRHHHRLADFGLTIKHWVKDLQWGLLAGIALLTISVYSERIYTAVFLLTPSQHPLLGQVENAASWRDILVPLFLAGLAAPIAEETLYRMFTFLPLKDRFGLWGGALFSAMIFALFHFNAYWLAEMIVVGVGLAFLYFWTGSLLSAIVAHSFINSAKIVMVFLQIPGI